MHEKVIAIFLILLCFFCAIRVEARTAERNDLSWVQVTAVPDGDQKLLRVRGCPFSSNACFSKPKVTIRGNEACLKSGLRVFRKGEGFEFDIKIPNNVERLVFGNNRTVIWPKDAGAALYSKEQERALEVAKKAFVKNFPNLNVDDYHIGISIMTCTPQKIVVFIQETASKAPSRDQYTYCVRAKDFKIERAYKSKWGRVEDIPPKTEDITPPPEE